MSERSKNKNAIGFPSPLLGERPLRLNVLDGAGDWLALDKPPGVGMRRHPWDDAPDLDSALNAQLEAGKPELLRTDASLFGSIYYLDPEISGVALFAKHRDALNQLRNGFGSGEFQFTFSFLSTLKKESPSEFQADAPLLPHRVKAKMIPSTAKGKKSFTQITRLADSDLGWTLWEAQVDFFRPHQVRTHAAAHGIAVLGDELYCGPAAPTVRQLQPRARRSDLDTVVYRGLAIHLSRVEFSFCDKVMRIESAPPKPFALLLKRLELSGEKVVPY